MQMLQSARNVQTSGIGEVHKATIRTTAKVFSFFSDQTYSDKPRTILRELVANAEDSRRMAGSTVPTVVTLPTPDNIATLRFWLRFVGEARLSAEQRAQIMPKRMAGAAALELMDRHLADHAFFCGNAASLADIAL